MEPSSSVFSGQAVYSSDPGAGSLSSSSYPIFTDAERQKNHKEIKMLEASIKGAKREEKLHYKFKRERLVSASFRSAIGLNKRRLREKAEELDAALKSLGEKDDLQRDCDSGESASGLLVDRVKLLEEQLEKEVRRSRKWKTKAKSRKRKLGSTREKSSLLETKLTAIRGVLDELSRFDVEDFDSTMEEEEEIQEISSRKVSFLPSSVSPRFGIYALTVFAAKAVVCTYPGRPIRNDLFEKITADHLAGWDNDSRKNQERVETLKRYGITILKSSIHSSDRSVGVKCKPIPEAWNQISLDWKKIYQCIENYSFEVDEVVRKEASRLDHTLVPEAISVEGKIIIDVDSPTPQDAYFVNEASGKAPFTNLLLQKQQRGGPNVRAVANSAEKKVDFIAIRQIFPGEEILITYGKSYNHSDWAKMPRVELNNKKEWFSSMKKKDEIRFVSSEDDSDFSLQQIEVSDAARRLLFDS